MSLPDYLHEDPSDFCACGNWARVGKKTCSECDLDLQDLYSEMQLQDAKEEA